MGVSMKLGTALKPAVAVVVSICLIGSTHPLLFAQTTQTASGTESTVDPWPRTLTRQGATISIYQPQLESWTGNLLDAYAAVTIKTQSPKVTNYGVIWFTARTEVDKVNRLVTLAGLKVTKQN